jgi:hypothetical protein
MAALELTPKEFEKACFEIISGQRKFEWILNQGCCITCEDVVHTPNGDCTCEDECECSCPCKRNCICEQRICPDIYGKYDGLEFVADCKHYTVAKLSKKHVEQIINYKECVGAYIGIIITIRTNKDYEILSKENVELLLNGGCCLISVKEGNDEQWKARLSREFKNCFTFE